MRTLRNHTLIYDDECPLCNVYTSAFVKTGMLGEHGRIAYGTLCTDKHEYVNLRRAKNEIALIDFENKSVIYGIDSLLKVIGCRFPFVQKIGAIKPINFVLRKLYSFYFI